MRNILKQNKFKRVLFCFLLLLNFYIIQETWAQNYGCRDAIVSEELIFELAPFPSCHASTIAETPDGNLVAAWFGGYFEHHPRCGIWLSRKIDGRWTPPVEASNGRQEDGTYIACWNPVLLQIPNGPLYLFHKVGTHSDTWWCEMLTSYDNGVTWTDKHRLENGLVGPCRCKPIILDNGQIVSPSSETLGAWTSHVEISSDLGKTWEKMPPLHTKELVETIQPTLFFTKSETGEPQVSLLCRNRNGQGKIWQSYSKDGCKTFAPFEETCLPNPCSGIVALTLKDGRSLLVYNHTNITSEDPEQPVHRAMINLAVSRDGRNWEAACIFENSPAEFSYPAMIQTSDGLVHITYTWKRASIKHIVLDPEKIKGMPMPDGQWPR